MKIYTNVGYGASEETTPGSGIWTDSITSRAYYGEIITNSRSLEPNTQSLNSNISLVMQISIIADEFAFANFMNIRYIEYAGSLWTITKVEVKRPRLLLYLGETYNGETA